MLNLTSMFDRINLDGDVLVCWKSMGEGSGFTVNLVPSDGGMCTELWETTAYGCNEYICEKWFSGNNEKTHMEEAYKLGMTFT